MNHETINTILAKTEEYLHKPAVVRFEHPFINHLADDFNIPGYEVERQDRLLVVRKKGGSPQIITAHIDRHGIVVNDEGKFEYAAFNAKRHYGMKNKSKEGDFKKSGRRFIREKVYAYDPKGTTLEEGEVTGFSYDSDAKDLLFEIDGFGNLPVRTPIAYKSSLVREEGNVSSQIDNAISVAVAYQLVQDGFDGTLVFATEEEIGRSWQHIVNYLKCQEVDSKEIITLDTTPYDNATAISEGFIVLRNKDAKGEFNPDLVQRLKSVCETHGIRYKMKEVGITELGRIVKHTNGRFNGATVQLPTTTTGYHTNHETTSELALSNYYEALKNFFLL